MAFKSRKLDCAKNNLDMRRGIIIIKLLIIKSSFYSFSNFKICLLFDGVHLHVENDLSASNDDVTREYSLIKFIFLISKRPFSLRQRVANFLSDLTALTQHATRLHFVTQSTFLTWSFVNIRKN